MDNVNLNKPHSMVQFSDPSEKEYLLLIIGEMPDEKEFRDFEWVTGRQSVYDFIKGLLDTDAYNGIVSLTKSKIIVEGEPIESAKKLVDFIKYVIDNDLIDDPGFDISDYIVGDEEEVE